MTNQTPEAGRGDERTREGDPAAVLVFATRYALGRRTAAPSIVGSELVRQQKSLSRQDADVLIRDIEAQAELGYGDRCDEEKWHDILGWLKEMRERGLFHDKTTSEVGANQDSELEVEQ